MMKVTFLLTTNMNRPIGGHKVVFEYANYLVKNGIKVKLIFVKHPDFYNKSKLYRILQYTYWTILNKTPYKNRVTWFDIDDNIECCWNVNPQRIEIGEDEKVVATASWTAEILNKIKAIPDFQKYYFIQSYEALWNSPEMVDSTWLMPFNKIVIATWLQKLGTEKFNVQTKLIPNFINSKSFVNRNPQQNREKIISLLIHSSELKQSDFGIRVLKKVQEMVPEAKFLLFGTVKKFETDLSNSQYFENATEECLNNIYNKSMIYLVPSKLEGWGLTAMEAMTSGAVVISNENGGIDDIVESGYNGWITDFDDEQRIANIIVDTINNEALRIKMVENSEKTLKNFSLEKSGHQFMEYLRDPKNNR
ncbi:glycosyltransferase family 4 protein [Leuconostoc lactis]|uniref:glycosyltransferase family 4 protein n=1 Tax=Leuconostoc lactis TaxID=1246 RepID=UPI0028AADF7D|nr:glycosyltransferase family 4 protein [Leuconostoc lactis]